ncbi:hypothetical protein R69776_07787 [Paraburkholderia nemoris]|uniref:Type II secretion system protein n=2 Tax=Paraburkholderia nemoris TaxID=2793076 RepID=A0ABM8T455_9BURK|nr:hypothetical protein R69776_07787 [Paraburkholderia nemoris]
MRGYSGNTIKRQAGYAYLALLILIAIIGVAAAATVQLGGIYRRRMAEKELLFIGGEFQRALASYGANTPLGQPDQPRTLDELVRDPRYPNPVHHLRKLYADPITGKADWLLVMSPDGQTIVGIRSASKENPIQIANFPPELKGFDKKKSYGEWVFMARRAGVMPAQTPVNAVSIPTGTAVPTQITMPTGSTTPTGPTNGAMQFDPN